MPTLGGPLQAFCNLWTFPASALLSAATLAVCCAVLVRRGQPRAALAWGVAWFVANVVEVVGKQVLHRPPLHAVEDGLRVSFDNFGHSFPSGHALRTVVTAALVVTVWRKAAIPVLVWAVVSFVALVDQRGPHAIRRPRRRAARAGRRAVRSLLAADAGTAAGPGVTGVSELTLLLGRIEAGELGDPLPVLAFLAGQRVELPERPS